MGRESEKRALLLDLDGVLRIWDPGIIDGAERRAGLPSGALARAAFGNSELLQSAITGRISDAQWRETIAATLESEFGGHARGAVEEWSQPAGAVDPDVLELVREQRTRRRVGLLSNATSRLSEDLARLGLDAEVDVVINTSDHGVAKPDPRIFRIAADQLGCPLDRLVFVDDTPGNVQAAQGLGITALHFDDAEQLRSWLDSMDDGNAGR